MVCHVFLKVGVNFNLINLFVQTTFLKNIFLITRQQIKLVKKKPQKTQKNPKQTKNQRFMIGRLLFCRVSGSHVFSSVYSDVVC